MIKRASTSFLLQIRTHWLPLLSGLLVIIGATGISLYFWLLADLPPISAASERLIRPTSQIVDRQGRVLYEILDPDAGKQINLALDELPRTCIDATLATEDSRFYQHPGFDPLAIARAA